MVRLGLPVVFAELGWMGMSVVDTLMVGPLGPAAIGAVGLGSTLFLAVAVFGMGLLLGLDTLVAQAFGARRLADCHRWLWQGTWLAIFAAGPLLAVSFAGIRALPALGIHGDVHALTDSYLSIVSWSALPLLLYAAFRRYLQALGQVRPVMMGLLTANLVNVTVNWVLIYGRFGAPALGTDGAAWATLGSRVYLAVWLAIVIVGRERRVPTGLWTAPRRPTSSALGELTRLGLPAALQVVLEVGVFAAATALAGRLDPASLASHQIAMNVAAVAFMVPLGISSAGAVRVGHAVGRGDAAGASRAGWTALALGAMFMSASAAMMLGAPNLLIAIFTTDRGVMATGVSLLGIAAAFQLFDGTQVVATGILRGAGNTRTPVLANLAGHWLFGLPVGYALCFVMGWGVAGLWVGLSLGLIAVGLVLLVVWWRQMRELRHAVAFERRLSASSGSAGSA